MLKINFKFPQNHLLPPGLWKVFYLSRFRTLFGAWEWVNARNVECDVKSFSYLAADKFKRREILKKVTKFNFFASFYRRNAKFPPPSHRVIEIYRLMRVYHCHYYYHFMAIINKFTLYAPLADHTPSSTVTQIDIHCHSCDEFAWNFLPPFVCEKSVALWRRKNIRNSLSSQHRTTAAAKRKRGSNEILSRNTNNDKTCVEHGERGLPKAFTFALSRLVRHTKMLFNVEK